MKAQIIFIYISLNIYSIEKKFPIEMAYLNEVYILCILAIFLRKHFLQQVDKVCYLPCEAEC
jgi:hypothetical protein